MADNKLPTVSVSEGFVPTPRARGAAKASATQASVDARTIQNNWLRRLEAFAGVRKSTGVMLDVRVEGDR